MKIAYITTNPHKFKEACHVLHDWELVNYPFELTEIQGEPQDIIIAKAKEAFQRLRAPLIVEDVSICCPALKGLPGPYIKDFLKKLSDHGIYDLINRYDDHRADAICHAAYVEPGKEPRIFKGVLSGTIVAPRGFDKPSHSSWNAIFQPNHDKRTFAELTTQEQSKISMRFHALTQLHDFLESIK